MRTPNASPAESAGTDFCVGRFARLRHWWRELLAVQGSATRYFQAEQRAAGLLTQNLSAPQRRQYETCGHFDVIGGRTGATYRIEYSRQLNVQQLDQSGACVRLLCFMPKGGLPVPDMMLAQKLALELFEDEAIAVANKINSGPFCRASYISPRR
jgi:hypothetical protein